MTHLIPLGGRDGVRGYAVVDPEDHELLAEFAWHLHVGYAGRKVQSKVKAERKVVLMHRQVMGLEPGDPREVDHINRDRLDNRRENLRVVTRAENRENTSPVTGSSSPYRGVHRHGKRWEARVRGVSLGRFGDELEAARAASDYRRQTMPFSHEPEIR